MGNDLFFKNCLSLLLRTEDIVEIFDEKIGEEDCLGGIGEICWRSDFRPHEAWAKADGYVIGSHFIVFIILYYILLKEV